jgi:hypothetical protein
MLSPAEIDALSRRCKTAQFLRISIACGEDYARDLGYSGEDPPPKVAKFSPAHLLHLIEGKSRQVTAQASVKVTTKPKKPSPTPVSKQEEPPIPPAPAAAESPTIEASLVASADVKADEGKSGS